MQRDRCAINRRSATLLIASQLALAYALGKAHGFRECKRLLQTFMDEQTERNWNYFLAALGR